MPLLFINNLLDREAMINKFYTKSGFTLIEIMIVIAIIIILASLGLPALLRSRIVANEATGGMAGCRTIINACMLYASNNEEYPPSLAAMIAPLSEPPYLDENLANATDASTAKNGYWFEYSSVTMGPSGARDSFTVHARPKSNLSGRKRFLGTEKGLIHYSDDGDDATENDPII